MPHLTPLLQRYSDELLVLKDDREKFLKAKEALIEKALLKLEADKAAQQNRVAANLPAMNSGRVKELVKFHEQQQKNTTIVDKDAAHIIRLRTWLSRQGAQLTPDGKVIWSKSTARVVYDNDLASQGATRIQVKGGLLYTADDRPLDTRLMVTAFGGPGLCIYVMSAEGHIHVSSHSVGHRHHSSLLAGAPVAGAGEMKVTQGRLEWITNKSGHYIPKVHHLAQVLLRLNELGVPLTGYKVRHINEAGDWQPPTTPEAFILDTIIPPLPNIGASGGRMTVEDYGYESTSSTPYLNAAKPGGTVYLNEAAKPGGPVYLS